MKCPICGNKKNFHVAKIPTGYHKKIQTTGVISEFEQFIKTGEKTEITCCDCTFVMTFNPVKKNVTKEDFNES